jgi:WD40 repeat protein
MASNRIDWMRMVSARRSHISCTVLATTLLSVHLAIAQVPEITGPRADSFGDPLPNQAVRRLGTVRFRHGDDIMAKAISPNGLLLASGDTSSRVKLWNALTGQMLHVLEMSNGAVSAIAFSKDNRILIAADDGGTIRRWQMPGGKQISSWYIGFNPSQVAITADANTIATIAVDAGDIQLWSAGQSSKLRTLHIGKAELEKINRLAFAPNGHALAATGTNGPVYLFDVASGKQIIKLDQDPLVCSVALSPNDSTMAIGSQGYTRLVDSSTGKEIRRWEDRDDCVPALVFSPDGQSLVAAGSSVRIWEVRRKKPIRSLSCGSWYFDSLRYAPDGRSVFSNTRHVIEVCEVATGGERLPLSGHRDEIHGLSVLPGGRTLLSASSDGTVCWSGTESGKLERTWRLPNANGPVCFGCSRSGTLAGFGCSRGLEVVNLSTGASLGCIQASAHAIDISPDEKYLAYAGYDKTIRLWEVEQQKEVAVFEPAFIGNIAFSPDGKLLANCDDEGSIVLWDVATHRKLRAISHGRPLIAMAFTPDCKLLASGGLSNVIKIWSLSSGREVRQFNGPDSGVASLAFSANGQKLVAGGRDGGVHIWNVETGKECSRFQGHDGDVTRVSFLDDKRLFSGGRDTTILLWSTDSEPRRASMPPIPESSNFESLWTGLGQQDAALAYRAMLAMLARPHETIPWLAKKLVAKARPVDTVLAELIRQLDNDDFAVRRGASHQLEELEEFALAPLDAASRDSGHPERAKHATDLVQNLQSGLLPTRLAASRAIEVLERIGSSDARKILQFLAQADPVLRTTQEARDSLKRLDNR